MGWLITGGILFLLAIFPIGLRIRYLSDGLQVKAIAGPVRITLNPMAGKEKEDKQKARTKPEETQKTMEESLPKPPQPPKAQKGKEQKKEKGGSLTDFLPLIKVALEFLGDFKRKLRIDVLYLRLILAGGDPCNLAVNYGRAWAAVGNLMPQLDRLFVIKKRDVEVECDFTASETQVIAKVDVTITLGRILVLAISYGIRAVREFLKLQKKRKGGAVK